MAGKRQPSISQWSPGTAGQHQGEGSGSGVGMSLTEGQILD